MLVSDRTQGLARPSTLRRFKRGEAAVLQGPRLVRPDNEIGITMCPGLPSLIRNSNVPPALRRVGVVYSGVHRSVRNRMLVILVEKEGFDIIEHSA